MTRIAAYMTSEDARGRFVGVTNESWDEVNVIETYAGQVRGRHYHEHTRELFYIVTGEVEIEIEACESGDVEQFVAKAGDIFVVEPMHLHTFRTLSDSIWINMLTPKLDPENEDFHVLDRKRPGA